MSEFSPTWGIPKMTKWQVRRYIQEMEEKRLKAKKELEEAKKSWELETSEEELKDIEDKFDDLF